MVLQGHLLAPDLAPWWYSLVIEVELVLLSIVRGMPSELGISEGHPTGIGPRFLPHARQHGPARIQRPVIEHGMVVFFISEFR